MDDRYEIRGKIGQGGIGAIYAGYDKNLHRDVAIKRIVTERTAELEVEASRQMAKEASALSKLQHPNIVTVYDVGIDSDGPFVVMELLQGKTIDEVVSLAPLTWQDFRELALQTNEALIAAQDMDLLHRDLKPTNVMLNWLPSGKFQIKVVDFGLAKFSSKPSLQTIDQKDSIFGSIYFMAPEQFERTELDPRTDMYSIGCVYYYALTGNNPFSGDTGPQVMLSHLDHRVYPLHEIRPDLPRWVADWVMWHINRLPEHRPTNARSALAIFLQSEKAYPSAPNDQVLQQNQESTNHLHHQSSRIHQHSSSLTITAPQPIRPPEQFGKPSVHTDTQQLSNPSELTKPITAQVASGPSSLAPILPSTITAPQTQPAITESIPVQSQEKPKPRLLIPSAPPKESTQSLPESQPVAETPAVDVPQSPAPAYSIPASIPAAPPTKALITGKLMTPSAPLAKTNAPAPTASAKTATQPLQTQKASAPAKASLDSAKPALQPLPNAAGKPFLDPKKLMIIAIALGVIVIITAISLVNYLSGNKEDDRYFELVNQVTDVTLRELEVTNKDIDLLLTKAVSLGDVKGRETIYKALHLSQSTDGTDVDVKLSEFTTSTNMNEDIRKNLLSRVIGGRKSPKSIPIILKYIKNNMSKDTSEAALSAIKNIATEEHYSDLMEILQFTSNNNVRKGCEETLINIVSKARNKEILSNAAADAYRTAAIMENKHALLRILGSTGTATAKKTILKLFSGVDIIIQIAAADACRNWPNQDLFMELIEILDLNLDQSVKNRLFQSCIDFLTKSNIELDKSTTEQFWNALAKKSSSPDTQRTIIRSLANIYTPWSVTIVKSYADTSDDDDIIDFASRALRSMESKVK